MVRDVRRPAGKAEAGVRMAAPLDKRNLENGGVLDGTVCRDRGKRGSVIC
jgi:hypothetical protein